MLTRPSSRKKNARNEDGLLLPAGDPTRKYWEHPAEEKRKG
ncbi:MAG TPA: hypothetical protein VI278_08615 [Nitrososphaeraceae archaeon]|jgi:hypothetical protein